MFRLMVPAMLLSAVCPNGPIVQMCMPLLFSATDRAGKYTPRVYLMALAYAVTLGGNLTLVGSTPCIAAQGKLNKGASEGGYHEKCLEIMGRFYRRTTADPVVISSCNFQILDTGFLLTGLLNCVLGLPAVWYSALIFAKEEDSPAKQEALENGATSAGSGSEDGPPQESCGKGTKTFSSKKLSTGKSELSGRTIALDEGSLSSDEEIEEDESAPIFSFSMPMPPEQEDLDQRPQHPSSSSSPSRRRESRRATYDVNFEVTRHAGELVGESLSLLTRIKGIEVIGFFQSTEQALSSSGRAGREGSSGEVDGGEVRDGPPSKEADADGGGGFGGIVEGVRVRGRLRGGVRSPADTTNAIDAVSDAVADTESPPNTDTILEAGCVVTVRADAKAIGKLRRQFFGLAPCSFFYPFLGRSRKSRQIFEVYVKSAGNVEERE